VTPTPTGRSPASPGCPPPRTSTFDGHEARELGICSRTLPAEEVLAAALDLARDVAAHAAPLSVAASKQLLWGSWDRTAAEVEASETDLHRLLMSGADAREGVESFLEKRPPRWQGSVSRDLPGGP
jgi:enoyl-CoA hydratase/carnithine racemase